MEKNIDGIMDLITQQKEAARIKKEQDLHAKALRKAVQNIGKPVEAPVVRPVWTPESAWRGATDQWEMMEQIQSFAHSEEAEYATLGKQR